MYLNKNRFNFYTRRLIWLAVSSIIRKVVDSLSFKASKYKDLTFTIKHCYETISILTCLIVCTARGFSDIKSTVCILYWILCNALAEVPIYHCHVACSTPTHTHLLSEFHFKLNFSHQLSTHCTVYQYVMKWLLS